MHAFWEMIEYLANTGVFVLSGLVIFEKGFVKVGLPTAAPVLLIFFPRSLLNTISHLERTYVHSQFPPTESDTPLHANALPTTPSPRPSHFRTMPCRDVVHWMMLFLCCGTAGSCPRLRVGHVDRAIPGAARDSRHRHRLRLAHHASTGLRCITVRV